MASIGFWGVTKHYDNGTAALVHLDLHIEDGEFVSVVGPSGCGKTTALRLLAGFEEPTLGKIAVGKRVVNNLPTRKRNLGLVTEDEQLMSHRKGRGNINFPMQMRGVAVPERTERIASLSGLMSVSHLLDRKPGAMSAGERRAVQLARALVARPDALLLDEPLSRIDTSLRGALRSDIAKVQQVEGVTTLLVTADQDDAMTMSDRIAVLVDGILQQLGTPLDLYDNPVNIDVARFIGEPQMNLLKDWLPSYEGRDVIVGIRPHDVVRAADAPGETPLHGQVQSVELHSTRADVVVDVSDQFSLNWTADDPKISIGDRVELALPRTRYHVFDAHTGVALAHPAG